jgi:carbamoyl-phosphate synthase large subunit
MDADVGVLVTGVGNGSTGEQIVKALQMGRRSYRITVTNVDPEGLVVADGIRSVLLPRATEPHYLQALAVAVGEAQAQFVIPGSDAELLRVVNDGEEFGRLSSAIPLVNNPETVAVCVDKRATVDAIERSGLAVPFTLDFTDMQSAVEAVRSGQLCYPVIIKPKSGKGGSTDVYVAQDETELRFFINYALHSSHELILQQYVGDSEHEFSVGVLHNPDGTVAGSQVIRRHLGSLLSSRLRVPNRTNRPELGDSLVVSTGFSQGEFDEFAEVRAAAERIGTELGSTGPLNVQGRLVGSEFYVFEINPRFSGSTGLRAVAGWNGPEALIDWHLGVRSTRSLNEGQRRGHYTRGLVDYVHFD